MRARVLTLLVAVLLAVVTPVTAQQAGPATASPAVGALANVASPEVAPDRRVTFRLVAPKAAAVSLVCECLTLEEVGRLTRELAQLGQRPATDPEVARLTAAIARVRSAQGERAMTREASGTWTLTLPPVEPDIYEYHFTVDGFDIHDPRNPVVKYNSRPNLVESLLDVPGPSLLFYEARAVPHGRVDIRLYDSRATGTTRRVFVYTPPGYDASTAKLPVLYLLHGGDGDETVWTQFGRMNLILDNLLAEKKVSPMIIATPAAYAYPPIGAVPSEKQRADFEKDLLGDLIPFIQSHYRASSDREHRALAGLSMGGGLTLSIGPRHLDLFSRLAVFSAGGGANPQESLRDVAVNAKDVNAQLKLLWLGIGTDDPGFANAKRTSDFLTTAGIRHTFKATTGAHTWIVWRRHLHEVAPLLWPRSAATN